MSESHGIHVLFICARNQWRSPTAEAIYRDDPRLSVRSRGLSESSPRKLTAADILWAELIFVMEKSHRSRVQQTFRGQLAQSGAAIHVLEIPDDYQFMDPELVDLLESGVELVLHQRTDPSG